MDPSLITRANKSTLTIGILSVIAPLLCAVPVILLSFDPISERGPKFQTFFLSACYAVTSFPAIFVLLGELKILNSELGRIALSSAITSDLLSLFMLIVGNVLNVWMQDGGTAALNELALVVAFLAVVFLVLRPGILMAIRYTPEGKAVTETCIFIIDQKMFGFTFYVVLYMATIVPVVRSLMHWKPYSELPIVSVIHVPDNVASVINLLEASCPTKENPMDVNVLHLIKLSGQANPIFISHQRKRRTSSVTASYSQNVIVSFNKFEGNNWGAVVLEKAPCSVGIFIDRDNLQRRAPMPVDSSLEAPSYKVAIIFLGGSDDREALTLSKRMSRDNRVALTVVRLTAQNSNEEWDSMLESEMLREMKSNGYINYMEKGVADGPETAMIVRSMVAEFDLIIVGRRYNLESPQTSGLKEWSEFPELGVLGDLLASVDNHSGRCSVLIVQQEEIVISSKPKMDMFP
ncbi:hypothetical protein ACOSQ4_020669 [Xanthoceras sorbifolium]